MVWLNNWFVGQVATLHWKSIIAFPLFVIRAFTSVGDFRQLTLMTHCCFFIINATSIVTWITELCLYQSVGQTDEDFQMDDALLDRAAHRQSQSHIESRERQLAIIGLIFVWVFLNFKYVCHGHVILFKCIHKYSVILVDTVLSCDFVSAVISCCQSECYLWQTLQNGLQQMLAQMVHFFYEISHIWWHYSDRELWVAL